MDYKKQLDSLFDQLCMTLNLNNFNEKPDYTKKSLKLDFNSVYGGYRIDTLKGDGSTGEGCFYYSSRFSRKEMISHIQGLLIGLEYKNK